MWPFAIGFSLGWLSGTIFVILAKASEEDVKEKKEEEKKPGLGKINTPCPSCGFTTMYVGKGGHLVCSRIGCPMPSVETVIDDLLADRCRQSSGMKECTLLITNGEVLSIMDHFDRGPGNANTLVDLCKYAVERDKKLGEAMRLCSGSCHSALGE